MNQIKTEASNLPEIHLPPQITSIRTRTAGISHIPPSGKKPSMWSGWTGAAITVASISAMEKGFTIPTGIILPGETRSLICLQKQGSWNSLMIPIHLEVSAGKNGSTGLPGKALIGWAMSWEFIFTTRSHKLCKSQKANTYPMSWGQP